jgi:hypothetical protein
VSEAPVRDPTRSPKRVPMHDTSGADDGRPRRSSPRGSRVLMLAALAVTCPLAPPAVAQSLLAIPSSVPQADPARAGRSIMFDPARVAEAGARAQPQYVESITVEARDPDAPRVRRKAFEQRFADSLLGPPPARQVGMRRLDSTPCLSVPSTWNSLGSSFAPLGGCP